MMKLSSDNGSITPRRAAARPPPLPLCTLSEAPKSRPRAGRVERKKERASSHTVYLPWRLFMLADGHLCCTHIALRSRSRAPLLSSWSEQRRVMANALRIKCILSLTARWYRCLDNIEITLCSPSHPFLPHSYVSIGYFLLSWLPSLQILIKDKRLSRTRRCHDKHYIFSICPNKA